MRAPLLLAALACTSCNAVWGIEAATGPIEDAGGNAPETAIDPCADQPGIAKLCLTIEAAAHPGYDVSTGAPTRRIDGAGFFKIYVFDKDPADPSVPYSSLLRHPLSGETKIDDLPATLPLPLSPGTHWVILHFEDNKITPRTGSDSYQVGDFITVPTRNAGGKYIYPKFDVAEGTTTKLKLPVQPLRRVDVALQADASLRLTYKDFAVNGDGPVTFALFDGAFDATTPYLELISTPCKNAAPMMPMPPVLDVGFTTPVTGTHKLVVSVEDYDSVSAFPTRGSLLTPTDATTPTITLSATSWSASSSLKLTSVLMPYKAGEKVDENRCP